MTVPKKRTIPWKRWAAKFLKEWVKPFLIVLVVLGAFRSSVANWYDVPTGSMKPTIVEGDRIFVNQLAYELRMPFTQWRLARWGDPQRGDIVICYSPANGDRLVKRVVGLPGDVIEMRNNRLMINSQAVEYLPLDTQRIDPVVTADGTPRLFATEALDGLTHPIMITPARRAPRSFGRLVVPPDRYFVMGDNRDESGDSRSFGFMPRNKIMGKSSAVVMSLDREHHYSPRWHRFFTRLR